LHPVFSEFIDLYASSCSPNPSPHVKLQLIFSVAFAITFTTASLLKAASRLLLPYSTHTLISPHAIPMPVRWAPQLPPPRVRRGVRFIVSSPVSPACPLTSPPHPTDCASSLSAADLAHLSSTSPLPSAHTSERHGTRFCSGRLSATCLNFDISAAQSLIRD
jgi:hypothetical protein